MNRMLTDLEENAKVIRSLVDARKERSALLANFLRTCRYPDRDEITINRMTIFFDTAVAPKAMLEMYRRRVHVRAQKKKQVNIISSAHCRMQTKSNGKAQLCAVYRPTDWSDGFVFVDHNIVRVKTRVMSISYANAYFLDDDVIAKNHAKNIMARKIQRFVREVFARPGGCENEKAKARWESAVDTKTQSHLQGGHRSGLDGRI